MLAALLHDFHVLRVVQVVDTEGVGNVERRVGERDQIDHHVGCGDQLVHLRLILRDIEVEVIEVGEIDQVLNLLLVDIKSRDVMDTVREQSLGQVDSDEAAGS